MRRLAWLALVLVSPLGCNKSGTSAEENPKFVDRNNIAGGGTIQKVRAAPGRVVNANELKNLHLFIENASGASDSGQLPDKQTILASLERDPDARNLVKDIKDGLIVLTGNTQRESVWAYEKNAPANGGWVVSNQGAERLSAAEVKQRLGMK
jgi:hypothetical protein